MPEATDTGEPRVATGRRLFAQPWRFTLSAPNAEVVPFADTPEVAFAGRSNVGKSSLINALTGQGGLARTSNTPGRTQQLNFFESDGAIRLVDMPGYGYAKAPKSMVEAWTKLVFAYLRGRPNLRRVYVLIDARHGLKANDAQALDTLDAAAVSYQVVLTKCDKPGAAARDSVIEATQAAIVKRPAAHPEVIATSSRTGDGLDRLKAEIAALTVA